MIAALRWRASALLVVVTLGTWLQVPVAHADRAGPGAARAARFDTELRRLVERAPRRRVSVIVQFVPQLSESRAQAIVRRHGGRQVAVIPLIHGVAAQMPARQARKLGEMSVVHAVSLNAPVKSQTVDFDPGHMSTWFNQSASTQNLWNQATGAGVGVAVIDSGVQGDLPDFRVSQSDPSSRVIASAVVNPYATSAGDPYGHGTMVAGLIAGDGGDRPSSDPLFGHYAGAAPGANLISVKVGDDEGNATVLDVLYGIQFAIDNRTAYNIRVINLSLQSDTAQSYKTDPLDAAVEAAWFDGVVVVVAAGNEGDSSSAVDYAPANDRICDHGRRARRPEHRAASGAEPPAAGPAERAGPPAGGPAARAGDHELPAASSGPAAGPRERASTCAAGPPKRTGAPADGGARGVLVEQRDDPGRVPEAGHLRARGAPRVRSGPRQHVLFAVPSCVTGGQYIMASGTSLAAPVVSGAIADILQVDPGWTPDMVKGALINSAQPLPGQPGPGSGHATPAGSLNANAAIGADPGKLNSDQGLTPNPLVVPGPGGASWDRSSWSRSSWSIAQGELSAPWARSSWSCTCSRTADGGIDPTRSSWFSSSWTVDFSLP